MAGALTTLERPGITLHVFTASEENYLINSLICELPEELLVVDAQMFLPDAEDFADVIDGLGKPVTRFLLSHNHPDHFSGFEVLCRRFPGVPVAALRGVIDYVETLGPEVIAARRAEMGSLVASSAVVPDTELLPGEEVIGGVRFVFEGYDDAEAESQLVIHMPDERVSAVFDLVCRADDHCFTVRPSFDHWLEVLAHVRQGASGAEVLIVGHGAPTDLGAIDATAEYVRVAKEVYAEADGHEDFAARMKARFPQRGQDKWIDLSAMLLYRVIYP